MPTLTLELATGDLGLLRWAVSPAWELLASIRSLAQPSRHAIHLPWVSAHRDDPLLTDDGLAAARDLALGSSHHLVGFLAPTPLSPFTDLGEELGEVRATRAAEVRRELSEVFGNTLPNSLTALAHRPRQALPSLTSDLQDYWGRTLAGTWPRLRALLEADIHYRARTLTERGPAAMFADMHTDLSFDAATGELRIANRHTVALDPRRPLEGRGLVLVPSAFAWPSIFVKTAEPWVPVIRYPVRGVGTLWEASAIAPDLAAVLGTARAQLLTLLDGPATTQHLATRTGLAAGGVSVHLHKLARAGLVTAHRVGREVLYARTARGDALVG